MLLQQRTCPTCMYHLKETNYRTFLKISCLFLCFILDEFITHFIILKHQFQQVKTMAAPFRSLRSSEHQCMQDFIHNTLPDILASIGGGRSVFNVMGIGSGAGEIDLEMLAQLHLKLPHAKVINKVVQFIDRKNPGEKMDFIHMIQVLRQYIGFKKKKKKFLFCLMKKITSVLPLLTVGESGYGKLWTTFRKQLCNTEISQCVTTGDIKTFLDTESIPYQNYELLSQVDITECFTEGDQVGELLLDFLMEVIEFSKNAPEDLKKGVLDLLRHPDCSKEVDGRIIFNNNLGVLVVEP
uniref:Histamine N-methyltransferase n=1 Tax=Cyprinus carpio TaxID=7962 RepID=A0A8C2EMW5_CYPCA